MAPSQQRHMFIRTYTYFLSARKHLMCCEGTAVRLKLPEYGVNKQRKA